jgi:translation initiation factor 2 beta subunit (eIF-2beta)/eIF-5
MEEQKINTIAQMINELNLKYKDNTYMLQRLESHLFDLPDILDRENKKYVERVSRFNELTLEQDNFYKVFLSKHQYFYMPYNSIYYEYDGKTYKIIKDDDIHYQLLSTITDEGKLIQWKHKTKQNIIKKIKERTLFKSTPETYTIQNVLGFLQTIFKTKTEAKYFLTIIGDCILKKNNDNLLYFVSSNLKKFVTLIDSIVYITTGNSIMNNFITKYHDSHKLNLYRLIKTTDTTNTLSTDIVKEVLNNIGIDLCCVATHYSDRYGNADKYFTSLQNTKDDYDIKNYVLYFVENSLHTIIDNFVGQCIENVESNIALVNDSEIPWKNMHYIWKLYLSSLNIPNMIYSQQLQEALMSKLNHKNDSGNIVFTNVTSKYLPNVSSFLSFWDKHIIITNDSAIDDEYEVDELMTLYKNYDKKISQISDTNMIKMICHYYSPHVEVIDNKYVTNIKCNLWSKHDDITAFLDEYKLNLVNIGFPGLQNPNIDIISFDDLYQSYKNYINAKSLVEQKVNLIVSKQFFEKYITNQLSEFIKFEKFVSSEWLAK